MPADSPNDSVGTPITVGATVKLVGVVQSINLFDNRYGDIVVKISNPLPAPVVPLTTTSAGQVTNQPTGADINPPNYRIILSFPPAVLTVGA